MGCGFHGGVSPTGAAGSTVGPAGTTAVQATVADLGGDCSARVRYSLTWAPEPPAI